MTFALCLQLPNHILFKRPLDIYANFVPQMIFLQSIFGYLVVCILYKWTIDWTKSPTQPPSLLNMLISMFLSPGTIDPATQLYPGQGFVQVVLLLMAAVCVPWLLITKPYFAWRELKKIQGQGYIGLAHGDDETRVSTDDAIEGEEEGNGAAVAEGAEDEHASVSSHPRSLRLTLRSRRSTTSVRWLFTRSFTRSSSVWDAFHILLRTFGYGLSRSPMLNYLKCYGI